MTRKELELAIVRCAERWPKRIGANGMLGPHDNHCIGGQIACEAGQCGAGAWAIGLVCTCTDVYCPACTLWSAMVSANNARIPWGQIPRRLGIVPGEQPATVPATEEPAHA